VEAFLGAMFVLGAASGLHCVGMCGGIAAASATVFPKEVLLRRQVLLNLGRIASYSLAGAVAGAIGTAAQYGGLVLPVQKGLYVLAHLVVILVALHIAGVPNPLSRIERLGSPLWKRIQPFAASMLSSSRSERTFVAGMAWGFIPCGLVYGALATAALSGTPATGGAAMAAFGLGTLPWLLAAGTGAARIRRFTARPAVRIAFAAGLVGMGAWGLARAAGLPDLIQQTLLCL
jgi:sulfite exporter TauE/SafE